MNHRAPFTLLCFLLLPVFVPAQSRLAIVGGTVIDVADRGRSTQDIEDAVVLVEDGRITAVGPRELVEVPRGFMTVDAAGRFVVPGLVDGFAVLNNQRYANAFLAMGVTSIIGVSGGRRGPMFKGADPGPHIYPLEDVGYEVAETDALLARVDALADRGVRVALLMYRLTPDKLRAVARRARERGLATIGELALTGYEEAAHLGVDAFVHTTRYSLGLAGPDMVAGIAKEPFSDALDSPKWRYYRWLSGRSGDDPRIAAYGRRLARCGVWLMPTASLLHLYREGAENPWTRPVARTLDPKDIHKPADPETGLPDWSQEQIAAYRRLAAGTDRIEATLRRAGCRYLAGSATDVWGTMPGISLHTELQWLTGQGLTPREALAAATSNFAAAFRWHEVGEVKAGRRGDLLILDADPREDVRNLREIHRVVRRGAVIDRTALLDPEASPPGKILASSPFTLPAGAEVDPDAAVMDRVQVHEITYRSAALRVKGFLVEPKGEGPFPCVIVNRGGNRGFGRIRASRVVRQLAHIASWGYVVAATQYRGVAGGTGLEEFGGAEVTDSLNLVPLLEGRKRADATRLGLVGGSRGGMTTWLMLRRSDRFRAAVIRAGLSDLVAWKHQRPEIESVYRELIPGYAPGRDALLESRSAVKWLDRLPAKTPVLLLHGTSDWRVPVSHSLELATKLQDRRHPYRLVVYEGDDHGLTRNREAVRSQTRAWLDRFVRDGEAPPDMKPHGR